MLIKHNKLKLKATSKKKEIKSLIVETLRKLLIIYLETYKINIKIMYKRI